MSELIQALQACREAEKEQALFYRTLAVVAEEEGDEALSERFNELHADEQHHLSRLTARLLELGASPGELSHVRVHRIPLRGWDAAARPREAREVQRYEAVLRQRPDRETEMLVRGILETERRHAEHLGGKWTRA